MRTAKPKIIVIRSRYEFSGIKRYLELVCHSLAICEGEAYDIFFAGHPDYLKYWPTSLAKPSFAFPFKGRMYRMLRRIVPRDRNLFGLRGMARLTRPLHNIMARIFSIPDENWSHAVKVLLGKTSSQNVIALFCQPYPDDAPPANMVSVCMWADFSEDRTPTYAEELRRSWTKWFRGANAVIFLAETIRRRAMELDPHLHAARARVIDVPPWILDATAEARTHAKHLLPDSNTRRYALLPARAHPRKMQHLLLEALPQVNTSTAAIVPVFCGPRTGEFAKDSASGVGEVTEYCRAVWECAARHGYEWGHDVFALGLQDENLLAALYERASLCIFPSRYEGLGLPLLEAMLFGLPVVCSDIPVFKEELQHRGLHAWYFISEDVESLSTTLKAVMADWDRALALAEANRSIIRQYSPEQFAREYHDVFSSLLKHSLTQATNGGATIS